jgi:hypothetical protein
VVVEQDKVATHVYRHNHDKAYNDDLPDDDILYSFYESLDKIYRKGRPEVFNAFHKMHGRKYHYAQSDDESKQKLAKLFFSCNTDFDLILYVSPRTDFNVEKTSRKRKHACKSVNRAQRQNILQFAHVVRQIEKNQKEPVYFLAKRNQCISWRRVQYWTQSTWKQSIRPLAVIVALWRSMRNICRRKYYLCIAALGGLNGRSSKACILCAFFSTMQRRHYFTNIPLEHSRDIFNNNIFMDTEPHKPWRPKFFLDDE